MEGEFDPFAKDNHEDEENAKDLKTRRASSSSSSQAKSPLNSVNIQVVKKKHTKEPNSKTRNQSTVFNPFTFLSSSSDDESTGGRSTGVNQKPKARKQQQQQQEKEDGTSDDVWLQTQDETAPDSEPDKRINKYVNHRDQEESEFDPFGDMGNLSPLHASEARAVSGSDKEEDRQKKSSSSKRKHSGSNTKKNVKQKKPPSTKEKNQRNATKLNKEQLDDNEKDDDRQKTVPTRKNQIPAAPKLNGSKKRHKEDDKANIPTEPPTKKQTCKKTTGHYTKLPPVSKRPSAKSNLPIKNIGGTLKDPPSYFMRAARTTNVATAASSRRASNDDATTAANHESSSATDSVAQLPLHASFASETSTFKKGIFSAKRTRDLDKYMKEKIEYWANQLPKEEKVHYSKIFLDDLCKKLALMVPTSEMELKADEILENSAQKKWGERIVKEIRSFLGSNQISIQLVRKKRKELKEERTKIGGDVGSRKSNSAASKYNNVIEIRDDDSNDENGTAYGATHENTAAIPLSTSSSSVAKKPPKSSVPMEGEFDPFGDTSRSSGNDEGDQKQKANKSSSRSNKRTREQRDALAFSVAASKTMTAPPSDPSDEGEYNPFGDSDNNNSDSDKEHHIPPIPTKSQKQMRQDEQNAGPSANKSPSVKPSYPTKHTALKKKSCPTKHMATKSPHSKKSRQMEGSGISFRSPSMNNDRRNVTKKPLDQRQYNFTKDAPAVASLELEISDSSSDDDSLSHPSANQEQNGILNAEKTEALNQYLLRKAQKRAELEREMGNIEIQHSTILSDDARKKISLLVPTSEKDLVMQNILSESDRREYGRFLIGIVEEFLTSQGISVAEIERKRKAKTPQNGQSGKIKQVASPETKKGGNTGQFVRLDLFNQQLVGQGYCTEWIDKDGQKLCVFGTVTPYDPSHSEDNSEDDKDDFLTIAHAENSRSLLNRNHTRIRCLSILESQPVDISRAWGGCLLYQEKRDKMYPVHKFEKRIPLHSQVPDIRAPLLWRVPDLYTKSTTFQKSAPNMPSLCLHYAGFQLEFTVKPSTIPNSGNGVFLSVTSLLDPVFPEDMKNGQQRNYPVFSLQPGEVLDIGVYAPLSSKDKTPDHIMMVRSVMQSYWCDCYSMNSRDGNSVFDITHGHGELSREARKSVLPFVNENLDWNTDWAEIQLLEDPQGSFHYALGYREDGNGFSDTAVPAFRHVADGKPREVFVDYGMQYELIRLRHGYPRVPVTDDECKQQLDLDEYEKLESFMEHSQQEVKDGVKCVYDYVTTGTMEKVETLLREQHDDRNDVRQRVLAVIIVLQARIEQIRPEVVSSRLCASAPQLDTSTTKDRGESINLRRRKQIVFYDHDEANDDADPERLSRRDWNTIDLQLQEVLDKLRTESSSPSALLSTLSEKADRDSVLGMACAIAIAAAEAKKADDDDDNHEDDARDIKHQDDIDDQSDHLEDDDDDSSEEDFHE